MIVSRALNADEPRTASVKGVMEVGYRPGPGDADGPDGPNPLIPVLTGVAVAILVAMAIAYTRSAGLVAGLWGASGVAVAVWLRTSRGRTSDLIFAGVMTVSILIGEIIAGNNPPLALAFTITNMIEIVGAVMLARRFSPTLNLSSLNGAVSFLIFAAVLAPIPAALCSVLILSQIGQTEIVWQGFQTWWLGHTLGIAVLGSLGMSLTPAMFARLLKPRKLIEAVVLIGLVPVFYFVAFTGDVPMGFVLPVSYTHLTLPTTPYV